MDPPSSVRPHHQQGMLLSPGEQQQLNNFSWGANGSESGNGAQDLLSDWLDFNDFLPGGGAQDTACYGGGLGEYAMQMPMGRGQI